MPLGSEDCLKKVARICWNSEGWTRPSGSVGKSTNKDSYEFLYGYGHEEWLLDINKCIGGFHYGYLQAVGTHRKTYLGQVFDISIYSINSKTKQRWWVGELSNVHVVGPEESKKVFAAYKEKGWYDEMLAQLKSVGADIKEFKRNVTPDIFAVIKFRPSDLNLLEEPLEVSSKDPAISADYYNLKNWVCEPSFFLVGDFVFKPGHNQGVASAKTHYSKHSRNIDLLHNSIQSELYSKLVQEHGEKNVGTELATGNGTRVDMAVKVDGGYVFYEIKTAKTARQCIRESLGQLVEYMHFGRSLPVKKLVVVSHNRADVEVERYVRLLRSKYNLPLYYEHFEIRLV